MNQAIAKAGGVDAETMSADERKQLLTDCCHTLGVQSVHSVRPPRDLRPICARNLRAIDLHVRSPMLSGDLRCATRWRSSRVWRA